MLVVVGSYIADSHEMDDRSQEESEQGRIQGALFSVQALASACGPYAMSAIYRATKDGALFGPGSMFVFASGFYIVAVYCAYLLPVRYGK
jgi:hypothetical protein